MLYLLHEAPPEEQNFSMVMEMIAAAEVHEDDDTYQSPLDILFERLEMHEPDSIACKQYRIFKQAAGKTAKSILVSVGVRLAAFNLPSIAKLTITDELHLQELGERKIALFCCIPDSDKSLNYLVGMIYTVYGRMFSLWMYAAIAPIPLSTFAGEPTSSVGKNFIRSYAGVCLQGVVIALSCIIFSAISSSPPAVDTGASVVTAVWTYVGELAFNLLVLVGAIKGCDRIVKEIMGL